MNDYIEWLSGTQKGFMEAYEGDGLVMERPWIARGTVQSQTSPTLTTNRGGGFRSRCQITRRLSNA